MASEAFLIPEVVSKRRPRKATAACPYVGSSACGLSQGVVAGGYTYIDPGTGTTVTIQQPGPQGGIQSDIATFLEETSPFFGLQWKWIVLGGFGLWLFMRKGGR